MRTKKTRKNRTPRARKSLKGVWGHKGAPPKDTRWPKGAFTYERLFAMNVDETGKDPKKSCELTLRNKVAAGLINLPDGTTNPNGTIYQLVSKKQPHGKVGRPIDVFAMKDNYDPATMPLKPAKPAKGTKPVRVKVTAAPAQPATPVNVTQAPVTAQTNAPANPRPLVQVTFTKNGPVVTPILPKVG
jgi:hypothetical protein